FSSPKIWVNSYGIGAGGWEVGKHPRMMADVNGDGKDDVIGFGTGGVYVSLSDGSKFSPPRYWVRSYAIGAGGWEIGKHPRMMADVNGDGKDDIVGFGTGGVYVSLSDGSKFSSPKIWVNSYGIGAGGWEVGKHPRMMADVNGDGKDDVIGFGTGGVYVSLSDGSKFSPPRYWVRSYAIEAGGWEIGKHPRMMADVNGDGSADIVGFGTGGVYVSQRVLGNAAYSHPVFWVESYGTGAGGWEVGKHPRMMADVNGDGKDDIVGFGTGGVYVSLAP
uniref:FG-GAP repeat domain-containing protein n=1 Tax=Ruegeria arenilitoris TaxID=1173585 RepID=UPI001480A348